RTWIESAHRRMIVFGYEMSEVASGAVLAKGETKHIFTGRDMKPARLPEKYVAQFGITRGVS
ncbi:MAG: hypothetical protein JST65_19515, partial [Acidobacteria bacterium]|nr:hypothetical protein [Acidobacteriota bacterium]